MAEKPVSIRAVALKYGLLTLAAYIIYFLIMRAAGLIVITEFRFLNYIFLAGGIYMAFVEVRNKTQKHRLNYLPGLGLGFLVTLISSISFAVFVFIYTNIDKSFIPDIKPHLPFSNYVNEFMVAFLSFSEPMLFGVIAEFVILQFFKRNRGAENEAQDEAEERA